MKTRPPVRFPALIFCAALLLVVPIVPAQTLTELYSFGPNYYGGYPGGLVQGANGNFYAACVNCGTNDWGAVIQLTADGTPAALYSFQNNGDGANPYGALTQGTNGLFYGSTALGGAYGYGSLFQISSNGVLTTLFSFPPERSAKLTNASGATPETALTLAANGNFYGTTTAGGTNGFGVVFELTHPGKMTVLYSFSNSIDGGTPTAPLFQFTNGNLYGSTTTGGSNNCGTLFQVTLAGKVTPLHSFQNQVDGATPKAALIDGKDGDLYGTCTAGGANGTGSIFKVTTNGVLTPLYSFSAPTYFQDELSFYNADGASPEELLLGSDNNFYGVAYEGGADGSGSIYEWTRGEDLNVLYSFNYLYDGTNADGANPIGLMQAADGNFYGVTYVGGAQSYGTFFRVGYPPQINLQPTNVAVALHANALFTVAASDATGCQWQFNGTNLPNATSTNLSLTNIQAGEAGSYQAIVTNLNGATTSDVVTLSVTNVPVAFLAEAGSIQYTNGQLSLWMTNLTGQNEVVIESSPDLRHWTPVFTNPPSFGALQFTDTNGGQARQFYRAIVR